MQGIIGIFCGIWAYIWGWMNATKLGLKTTMIRWTLAFVVAIIGASIVGSAGVKAGLEEAEKQKLPQVEMTPTE